MTKRIRMTIAIVLCAALLLGALAVYAADSSKQSGAAVQSGRVDETGNPAADSARVDESEDPAADSARVDESEDPAADSARVDESVNGNASRIDEAKKSLLPEGVTETPIQDGISIYWIFSCGLYFGSASMTFDLPGTTLKIECDNEYLFDSGIGDLRSFERNKSVVRDGCSNITIRGAYHEEWVGSTWKNGYDLEASDTRVRITIMDGDEIIGYALCCFWNPYGCDTHTYYESGAVVKAVMFEYDEGCRAAISPELVDALLDNAVEELITETNLTDMNTDEYLLPAGCVTGE